MASIPIISNVSGLLKYSAHEQWSILSFILFQCVQIMGANVPDRNTFKYTKTHSHVTFVTDDKHDVVQDEDASSYGSIGTQGTPLMSFIN